MVKFRLFFFSFFVTSHKQSWQSRNVLCMGHFHYFGFFGVNFYINIGQQDMGEAFLKSILPEGIVLIAKITQKRSFDAI